MSTTPRTRTHQKRRSPVGSDRKLSSLVVPTRTLVLAVVLMPRA